MQDAAVQMHEDHPLQAAGYVRATEAPENGGASPEPLPEITDRVRKTAYAGICFGVIAVSLDLTIINVALPQIRADLGGDIETVQWVASLYSLAYAVFLIPAGRLVDMVGPRRIMITGSLIYAGASLIAGMAPTDVVLIAARVPQGLGASMVAPASAALIAHLYDEGRRGAAFGALGGLLGVSAGVAPLIGGILTDAVSWRAIFLINIPATIISLLLLRGVPASVDGEHEGRVDLDLPGTVLLGVSVLAINLALIESGRAGFWPWGVAMLAVAVVAAGVLWRAERERPVPIVDIGLLRDRVIAGSLVAKMLVGFSFYGALLYLTLYLQGTLGLSAVQTGAVLLPSAAVGVFLSPWIGKRVEGRRARPFIMVGLALTAMAQFLLALLDSESSVFWHLMPGMVTVGIGYAFVSVAGRVAPTDRVRPEKQGRVSGLLSMGGKLAGGLGVSFSALVFHALSAENASDALSAGGAGVSISEVVSCLAVDDLHKHIDEVFPDLGPSSITKLLEVIENTFLATLGDLLMVLGLVIVVGSIAVWWMLGNERAASPGVD
ncbi:MAG: MFS transporter [Actinomycetia bacterium]|nr:MFS transporter [Actinomycetes bacterium]